MFSFIGLIFKYSFLVLTVLVLSHIIEIEGVTISQHVLHAMHFVTNNNPKTKVDRITADYSKIMQNRIKEINQIEPDEDSPANQQALNRVIERSEKKK